LRWLTISLGLVAFFFLAFLASNPAMATSKDQVTLSYSVIGGGAYQPPLLHYTFDGQILTTSLTSTPTVYSMDAGSSWEASQDLPGSNASIRWEIPGNFIGIPAEQSQLLVYYRQCFVTFDVSTDGNTHSFVFPTVSYVSFEKKITTLPSFSAWADYNSTFRYGNTSSFPPTTRWYPTGANGVISAATRINPVYIQQYLISVTLDSAGPDHLQSATVSGTSGGKGLNQTVTAPSSSLWLDYNSSFSFQPTIYPATGTNRWVLHSVSAHVAYTPLNLNVTYIEQYPFSAIFTISSGTAPSGPVLTATVNGQLNELQLYPGAPESWVDAGSSYTIASLLGGSTSSERWITNGNVNGAVSGPVSINLEYFHQVKVDFSYAVAGGGSIGSSNAFYEYFGAQTLVPLSTTRSTIWADAGTDMAVQGTFAGQSPAERWELGTSALIPIQKPENLSLVYYHQRNLQLTYSIAGGGSPTPPSLTGSALGAPFTSFVLSGNTAWLDSGSTWGLSEYLQSSTPGERWAASGGENGTVGQQTSFDITYDHEYLLTVQPNSQAGGKVSQGSWVPVGQPFRISAAPSSGWAFARWLGTGQGSYSGPNSTLSIIVNGPIQETARFDLRIIIGNSGSGSVQASFGSTSYSVGGSPLTFFVAPGTNVTLVARPGPFETFAGWHGIQGGNAGAIVFRATSPLVVTASFGINKVLVYGLVVLYWGAAVFAIFYLMRNKRISLKGLRGLRRSVDYHV
jgi:hypothetical protein